MLAVSALLPLLEEPKKILITTHFKPDGDALGSSLGLYHYLIQKGHQICVVSPSEVPDFLQWMPGIDQVLNFETDRKQALAFLAEADLVFCLDFNHLSRVRSFEEPLRQAKQPRILIDHHLLPEPDVYAYGISEPDKSSTCEMVYDFILLNKDGDLINQDIMDCLYTGTMTDTGSFRFSSTAASTHRMVADFKDRGFDHRKIHEFIYDGWSERKMRFLGFVLSHRMEIFHQQHTGLIAISMDDLNKYSGNSGDTEGLVNYPLSIKGIRQSVLLIERNNEVKLSFRSKGDIDVSQIASAHFDGGGHFNAAGGQSKARLPEVVQKVKELLQLTNHK